MIENEGVCHLSHHVLLCRNYTQTVGACSKRTQGGKGQRPSSLPHSEQKTTKQVISSVTSSSVITDTKEIARTNLSKVQPSSVKKQRGEASFLNQVTDYIASDKFHHSVVDRLTHIQVQTRSILFPEYIKNRPKMEDRKGPNMNAYWWFWNILLAMTPGMFVVCICEFFRSEYEDYNMRIQIFQKRKALGDNFEPTPEEKEFIHRYESEEETKRREQSKITLTKICSDIKEQFRWDNIYDAFKAVILGNPTSVKDDNMKSMKEKSPQSSSLNQAINNQRRNSPLLSHRYERNNLNESKSLQKKTNETDDSTKAIKVSSKDVNNPTESADSNERSILLTDLLLRIKAIEDELEQRAHDDKGSVNVSLNQIRSHDSSAKKSRRNYSTKTNEMHKSVEKRRDSKSSNITSSDHPSKKTSVDIEDNSVSRVDPSGSRSNPWWKIWRRQ